MVRCRYIRALVRGRGTEWACPCALQVDSGYILGSVDQAQMPFADLGSLIIAYAKASGCLPVCLNLDSFNTVYEDEDERGEGQVSFVDPDYQDMVDLMKNLK